MRVLQPTDAREFLAATRGLRAADPVGTNMLGSIAQSVTEGRSYDRAFWFVVVDDDATVIGAALWTLPHKLLVGPMSPAAAHAIGVAAASTGVPVHGMIAPLELADAVASGAGSRVTPYMGERVMVLGGYVAPPVVAGAARRATSSDLGLTIAWTRQFAVDCGILVIDAGAAALSRLETTWIWEVAGNPVSMAGHAPVVRTPGAAVVRIGPVYTLSALRGHGYGSAITAAVVEHLLPEVDTVMLYTDAANPTSNAIYERLGFAHVADVVDVDLSPR